MSRRALNGAAAISFAALVCLAGLAWSHHGDAQRSGRYGQLLRGWLALELRLTAELLRARAGVVSHYDGIVQTAAARRRALHALQNVPPLTSTRARSELQQLLAAAARDRVEADRLIERWKREHSVLRNSLRFLPHLAAEIQPPVRLDTPAPAGRSALGVVQDALLLAQRPEHSVAERLGLGLGRLEHERLFAPAAERGALESLLVHARIVQERSLRLHALTSALIDPAAARHAQRANDLFAAELRDQARRAEADGLRLLIAGLTCAALLATSVILRLRRSAAALQETGRQLSQAVQSLRAEQAKQRELSELKSRFVAMASHEFRTPLSVIMSSAELLEAYAARWPASKNAEHFARVRGAALGMTRMLDEILMIAKSDAGALRCDAGALEIGAFCAEVVSYMGQADPDCRRIVYQGPDHPTTVYADRALLRQVLENLLSNAVKYSPDDTPVLCEVACRQRELQLRVVDRGIGISRADQRHLFETFQRGSNVGSIRGTGLGLAVVGRAVQLHGGEVSVHSDVGMGSEFLVRIPCVESGAWAEYS